MSRAFNLAVDWRRGARMGALAAGLALLLAYVATLFATDQHPDLITDVAAFKDTSGRMTLSQVRERAFAPTDAVYGAGYDSAAHWLRIGLAETGGTDDLLLVVSAPPLDSVTLFVPDGPADSWRIMQAGDRVPFAKRDSRRVPISFVVPHAVAGQDLYLRVASTSPVSFAMTVGPVGLLDQQIDRQVALHIVYFALLVMGILLAALRLSGRQSQLSLAMLAFLVTYLVYSIEGLGYGPIMFDGPDAAFHDRLTTATSVLTVVFSMLFQRFFLCRHAPDRRALFATDLVICAQVLLFLPMAAGHMQMVGIGTVATSLVFLGLLVVLVATARIDNVPLRRVLVAAYGVYIAISAVWMASRTGLFAPLPDTRHFIEIFGLNSLFIALTLLVIDMRQRKAQQRATVLSLAAAQSAQAAHDANSRTQESFMHMLVHEVRNHLSVLQLGLPKPGVVAQATGQTPADHSGVAEAVRALDRALTRAQHLVWLDQGRWPQRPASNAMLEALDRVAEDLGLSDRISLQGDSAEAAVHADPAMLDALLRNVFLAALQRLAAGRVMTLGLSQAAGAADGTVAGKCLLLLHIPVAETGGAMDWQGPEAALAARLADELRADLRVGSEEGAIRVVIVLPP